MQLTTNKFTTASTNTKRSVLSYKALWFLFLLLSIQKVKQNKEILVYSVGLIIPFSAKKNEYKIYDILEIKLL
jgi:hypothetical protein